MEVAALLLAAEDLLEDRFLQQVELRLVAKETCLVDGKIFEQQRQFRAAFAAGKQTVISVKGIELANFQAALQAVFEKMSPALVEEHAAFLIHERLQQLQFSICELHLRGHRSHMGS